MIQSGDIFCEISLVYDAVVFGCIRQHRRQSAIILRALFVIAHARLSHSGVMKSENSISQRAKPIFQCLDSVKDGLSLDADCYKQ
jgi:hypothetical protein